MITNIARPIASGAKVLPPSVQAHTTATTINATIPAAIRRWAAPSRSPRFQASSGPNGNATNNGMNSGRESEIEERRADRNLFSGYHFQRQRIKRSDKNRRAGGGEEQIIENERALPRDRREQTALLERRCTKNIERKTAADEDAQD